MEKYGNESQHYGGLSGLATREKKTKIGQKGT
jgi:hypothetical protein